MPLSIFHPRPQTRGWAMSNRHHSPCSFQIWKLHGVLRLVKFHRLRNDNRHLRPSLPASTSTRRDQLLCGTHPIRTSVSLLLAKKFDAGARHAPKKLTRVHVSISLLGSVLAPRCLGGTCIRIFLRMVKGLMRPMLVLGMLHGLRTMGK